ncbi:MAG: LuxR family transcriptional regulator [Actinobacteria bacterium]|nr:LuxR family transcriptional regulator [Actinomycetota bacterium]MBI3687324.1 LuxR family transcriptional regulator [Actinomycetota bacterium]
MNAPHRVLGADGDLTVAVAELRRAGWRPRPGFALPDQPWDVSAERVALVGDLTCEEDARAAARAAMRGAALVVRLDHTAAWVGRFLAELRRLGANPEFTVSLLSTQHRALLDLLAEGASIARAAGQLYISLRTANRRVAEARAVLGTRSTREAVLVYLSLTGGR